MPDSVFWLILAAVAALALFDVGFGHFRPDPFGGGSKPVRIGLREFATRPLPIFLCGVGVAMLPDRPMPAVGLLLLAAALALFGGFARFR
jgi:hypothetical protein